ncbi:hypothetical protein CHD23_11805 [Salmonella enterica]|nr:hypothetical protein CHD23_11805 [Salmonella enterica]
MLRHIFIAPAFPECTKEQLSHVVARLKTMENLVPSIRALTVTRSEGLSGERPGMILIADFDTVSDWESYMADETHQQIGREIIRFIDADRGLVTQGLI